MNEIVPAEVVQEKITVIEQAKELAVTNDRIYEQACEFTKTIKGLRKKIKEHYDTPIQKARESLEAIRNAFKQHDDPLAEAEEIVKAKTTAFHQEQEARAERERQEAYRLAAKRAEDEQVRQAALLEEMGHKEAAEQLLNQEPVVLQVASTPAAPKVAGISFRDSYSCEVVSVLELARWVVDHPNHANLIQGNQVALNQLARVMKGGMNIPGVRAVCKKIQSAGSV